MFFVTLLLNEVVAWMRAQPGTGSLRAMLYMDEVFGFFPPSANPPAKLPMLTLLKQARAFGLGCTLCTQNPVDLDYKGLANAGTWFLGRLQTERDKLRVIEGLEGASAAAGKAFDRQALEATLAGLKKREFLVNNVHEDAPILMETRHTLSYLRGPLTRKQIQVLMEPRRASPEPTRTLSCAGARPVLPSEIRESFLLSKETGRAGERLVYRPALLGTAKLHFVDAKAKVDAWRDVALLLPIDDGGAAWDGAEDLAGRHETQADPDPAGAFDALPPAAAEPKSFAAWSKRLAESLYRTRTLELPRAPSLQLVATPGESEGDFRIRVQQAARERRDRAVDELRAKYASRIATLRDREARAGERVERERSQAAHQSMQTAISFGATVLGAILGRKTLSTGTVGRATTAARGVGRTLKERQDIEGAEQSVGTIREKREALEAELDAAVRELSRSIDPAGVPVESASIKPRKSDVTVEGVQLAWVPWWVAEGGSARPAR
jgi:hypothetical protein